LEQQIETADVDMSNYGVIVSSGSRKILRSMTAFSGRINHDLGRDPRRAKLAGSHRRAMLCRMLEQHDVLFVEPRHRTIN
jgi:hypothetical protein